MPNWKQGLTNGLLNIAVLLLGFAVMLLVYAFVTRTTTSRSDPTRAANPTGLVGEIIQVEVRNGAGVDFLAAEVTQFLRERGFDVVEVGNYSSFNQEHSVVIDRVGDLESAKKVAAALGIPAARVRQDIRTDYYLDASVVIGEDYRTLLPFSDYNAEQSPVPPRLPN